MPTKPGGGLKKVLKSIFDTAIHFLRLDFEPKTSSDFVDNLDLLDTIEDTITDLKVSFRL